MSEKLKLTITPEQMLANVKVDYTDGDIVIIDDRRELPSGEQLHIDMVLVLLGKSGRAQFDMNGKTYKVSKGQMVIFPPNTLIDNYLISPDANLHIIGMSYPALQRMLHSNNEIWDIITAASTHPVFDISEDIRELVDAYYNLLKLKLSEKDTKYRKETMRSLLQAIFYELCDVVNSVMPEANELSGTIQGSALVKKFLRLLANAQGEQRNVGYFARQLCVSAKHLSTVCRKSTGRTAKDWIQEYTVEILRHQLLNTERSIKEISNLLGFPNLSVFGKFCRSTLGMSPTEYRATKGEANLSTQILDGKGSDRD